MKEREFMKKLWEILDEEEKLQILVAQGLPWTTDEPKVTVKLNLYVYWSPNFAYLYQSKISGHHLNLLHPCWNESV